MADGADAAPAPPPPQEQPANGGAADAGNGHGEDRDRDRDRRSRHRDRDDDRRKKKSNFDVTPGAMANGEGAGAPGMAPGMMPGMGPGGMMPGMRPGMYNPMMMQQMMAPRMAMPPPMASSQQTRHARRLYVGGCGDTSEQEMTEFFTHLITKVVKAELTGPPVLSVYVNRERRFSFVEFASIELASAGLNLDGVMFKGNPLRVRRPNDYRPELVPPSMAPPLEVDLSAIQRGGPGGGIGGPPMNTKDRIFIGGIPYTMTEPQIRELLAAFGPLKDLQLIQDNGMPKGYGFAEYQDPSVTDKAIQALNGIRIGERELTVRRANPPGTGRQTQAQAAPMMGMPGMGMPGMGMPGMGMPGMGMPGMMPGMGMPGMPAPGMPGAGPVGVPPTRVVVLMNMVSPKELADEVEYKEILEDVEDECGKFGAVASIQMPKPGEPACGKVFVEFKDLDGAQKAAAALNNRRFGDNTVATTYYEESKFAAKELA